MVVSADVAEVIDSNLTGPGPMLSGVFEQGWRRFAYASTEAFSAKAGIACVSCDDPRSRIVC